MSAGSHLLSWIPAQIETAGSALLPASQLQGVYERVGEGGVEVCVSGESADEGVMETSAIPKQ